MFIRVADEFDSVTVNPFNTTLTSGGSSGGEGALVGFRGSCLGIGTDIGGSIRSPAANNGQCLEILKESNADTGTQVCMV